jgi:hypothetical protein
VTASGIGAISINAAAYGGSGGDAYYRDPDAGDAGAGGVATARASGSGDGGVVSATAQSGNSGGASGAAHLAADGVTAAASARGVDIGTKGISVNATAIAGTGSGGDGGAAGGNGATVWLSNAVSGSSRGSLSLSQIAVAGAGGSTDTGTPGRGGDATSMLSVSDSAASALTGSVSARAGSGGIRSDPNGSGGDSLQAPSGNALASISMTSTRIGTAVSAQSLAVGGGMMYSAAVGAPSGSGTASATAISAGDALSMASAVGGGALTNALPTGQATATATSRSTLAGYGASAHSAATNTSLATSSAYSYASAAGVANSIADGQAMAGQAQAVSTSTGGLGQRVVAGATVKLGPTSYIGGDSASAMTMTSFGATGLVLPDLSSGVANAQAFSYADGAPDAAIVAEQLAAHPHVAGAVAVSGLQAMGLGSMGVQLQDDFGDPARSYTTSVEYSFALAAPGGVLLGLLDFTGQDAAGPGSLTLDIYNLGHRLLDVSFASVAAAEAYFTDQSVDLGTFAGSVDLTMTFTVTGAGNQGADFSYVLSAGELTTPVPEPAAWWLMLAGLGGLAAQRVRKGRATRDRLSRRRATLPLAAND